LVGQSLPLQEFRLAIGLSEFDGQKLLEGFSAALTSLLEERTLARGPSDDAAAVAITIIHREHAAFFRGVLSRVCAPTTKFASRKSWGRFQFFALTPVFIMETFTSVSSC